MRATRYVALSLLTVLSLVLLLKGGLPQVFTGTWTAANSLTAARSGSAAAVLPDGRILFTGGTGDSGPLASAEFFNPDGSTSSTAPMQDARTNHIAVVLQDGRVLVAGGSTFGGGITNAAELYNPSTNSWTPVVGGMTAPRAWHTASRLKDGTVLIAGGQSMSGTINTLEVFSPDSNTFIPVTSGTLSSPRQQHAAAALPDGRVLIAGGSNGSASLNSTDIFDPAAAAVSAGPNLSTARAGLSATTLIDGRVLLAGGNDGTADVSAAEVYDPFTGTISGTTGGLATPRRDHLAFVLPNNNGVLIVGGSSAGTPLASAELFYPWTGAFTATGPMASPRTAAAGAALKQDGYLLVAGGSDGTNPLAGTELYGFATVKTNQADYAPGTTAVITGSGWQPGETVTLTLVELPYLDTHGPFTATADASGNIYNNQFVPDEHDAGIKFYLMASGSVSQAQTTFTDAGGTKLQKIVVGAQTPSPIAPGGSATYSVTVSFNGNGTCTASLSVGSGLPAGATTSFNPGSGTGTSSAVPLSSTLTVTTAAGTTPNTYTFPVVATGTAGDCVGDTIQTNGTLVVIANEVGTMTVGAQSGTLTFGTAGSATYIVTVNRNGATGTAFSANLSLTTSLPAGARGSFSPSSVSFAASDTSKTSTLTISTTAVTPAGSPSFTVQASNPAVPGDSSTGNGTLAIQKATPTITWANPADITYGTALGVTQLNATASVPGSFAYTPAAGTTLNAGNGQTLSTTFTPTDTTNYNTATKTVTINVLKGVPVITWSNLADITYPTALSGTQLNATASVPGIFAYTPAAGTTLNVGNGQTLSTTFTPTDTANYNTATKTVTINVLKGTSVITWSNPADITYPTALSGTQLNATANVPGTFAYTPAAGTTLNAGNGQTLSTTFTPTDTTNYSTATKTVTINVLKGTPVITWSNPADITYPTALSGAQLNATASVPGSFVYSPAAGSTPNAGNGQTLSTTFTPTDTANYNTATKMVTINVQKGTATVTLSNLTQIFMGVALTPTAATAPAGLALVWTNAPQINAGSYSVTATVNDPNYTGSASGTFIIEPATAGVTVTDPNVMWDGSAHGATISTTPSGLAYTATYTGTGQTSYAASTTQPTDPGTYAVSVKVTDGNYFGSEGAGTLTINNTDAVPSSEVKPLYDFSAKSASTEATVIFENVTVKGITSISTVAPPATPVDTAKYKLSSSPAYYDLATSAAFTGNIQVCLVYTAANFIKPANLVLLHLNSGTHEWDTTSSTVDQAHAKVCGAVTSLSPFTLAESATTTTTLTVDNANPTYGTQITLMAAVAPTDAEGTVQFYDNGSALGSPVSITGGQAQLTTSALTGGTHSITATYMPSAYYSGSESAAVGLTVAKADQAPVSVSAPSDATYGQVGLSATASGGSGTGAYRFSAAGSTACTVNTTTGAITVTSGTGTCSITAKRYGDSNYNDSAQSAAAALMIHKADATISVTPYKVTYDSNAHTATGTATGVGGADLSASLTLSGTTHTNTGTYNDTWTFSGGTNYNDATGTVKDCISKADATISVTPYNVTYDGNAHTATGTATGVSSASLSGLNLSGTTHTNAGDYPSDAWTFTDVTGNYNNTSGTVHDSITKATASITVTPYKVTYDSNAHTATGTATGVGGADLSASLTLSGTTHTNAGDSPSDPWSFSGGTNYNDASGTVHDNISKANATITVSPYSVTYDASPHMATGTAKGLGGVSLSGLNLSGTTHTNAATYNGDAWSFTDATGNYNNANGTVNDSILKASASISVTPYNVTYDGNAHTATGTATGLGGVSLSGLNLSGTTHTNAATYNGDAWSFTDATGNYNNTNGTVNDSITKAPASVGLSNLTQTYTGSPLAVTATTVPAGLQVNITYNASIPINPGSYSVNAMVTDPNYAGVQTGTLTINDVAPSVTITAPASGFIVAAKTNVTFTGTFSDIGTKGPYTAKFMFDGGTTVAGIVTPDADGKSGTVTATYSFTSAGVYNVTLAVTDAYNTTGTTTTVNTATTVNNDSTGPAFIVVYDPSAGFVTGGGWIYSPAGAYAANPTLAGKANFGFVSKYQSGAKTPTGETEFNYQVANFNFHASVYQWLVVSGSQAQYKGTGTINGSGNYNFLLTASDGDLNNPATPDGFRIKITDPTTSAVIYDNKMSSDDTMTTANTQNIGGGSIVIHTGK